QIVHFDECNSGGIVHTTYYRSVATRWQIRDDCGLPWVARSVAAGLNLADLITGDNPADCRMLPIIVGGNQSSRAVVQLQCRISQCIGNAILCKLRTNGTHNDPLWSSAFNNEPANHHVVPRLHKPPRTNVAQY